MGKSGNKGASQTARLSAGQQALAEVMAMTVTEIEKLSGDEVLRLCRENRLPVPASVSMEQARRELKALRLGGRDKYIAGYTLCPYDGYLAMVETVPQREPPVRWMRCTGPRRCRFKR